MEINDVKMPRAYLEPEHVELLEKAAGNMRDRLLVRLLFHSACRISAALGLTVDEVDLENGQIVIQHLKTKLNLSCPQCGARLGRRHVFCPACGRNVTEAVQRETEHKKVQALPIDPETLASIDIHGQARGSLQFKLRLS